MSSRRRRQEAVPALLAPSSNLSVSFAGWPGTARGGASTCRSGSMRGTTLGIVGESGCGKSVTSLAIIRLLGARAQVDHGSVSFDGRDLLALPEAQMREIRGT